MMIDIQDLSTKHTNPMKYINTNTQNYVKWNYSFLNSSNDDDLAYFSCSERHLSFSTNPLVDGAEAEEEAQ